MFNTLWGHPHSTYTQRGRGVVKPNAYDCVQGERGVLDIDLVKINLRDK